MLWTESHVEEEECGDDFKKYVVYGNNAADEAAKERRVVASVAPGIVGQWIRCYGLAEKSLHRMATLLVAVGDGLQGREKELPGSGLMTPQPMPKLALTVGTWCRRKA